MCARDTTLQPVHEIARGLWHWTARRESINSDVSSYYLTSERVLIDPMIPADGIELYAQDIDVRIAYFVQIHTE